MPLVRRRTVGLLALTLLMLLGAGSATSRAATVSPSVASLQRQVATLQSTNRVLTARIVNANQDIGGHGTLSQRIQDLTDTLGGRGSASQRAAGIGAILQGDGPLTHRAQQLAGTSSADSSEIAGLTTQNHGLTAQTQTLTSQNQGLTAQTQTLMAQNQGLTAQTQTLAAQNQDLTTQNATLAGQIDTASTTVGGTGALPDRLDALANLVGGTGPLTDAVTAADQTLGGGGNLTTDSNNYVAAAGSSAATIVDAETTIGGSGTLATRLDTVDSALGASGTIIARLTGLSGSVLTTPTGDLTTDVATLDSSLVTSPGHVLQTDLTSDRDLIGTPAATLQGDLNGVGQTVDGTAPTTGTPIISLLGNQIANVQGSASQLSSAITAADNAVGGSGSSIDANITSLNTTLGGSGTAVARTTAIQDSIRANPGPTVTGDISSLDSSLLTSPTGTLSTDLATVRGMMVTSPGASAQADVSGLDQLINGTSFGSTLQARIGSPVVNGSASNLATVIGTSGSDLSAQLGDPGGQADIASMIGSTNATSLTGALGNTSSGSSSINDLLGGNQANSLEGNIVGNNGILAAIDGTATDSGNITAKLSTQTGLVAAGQSQLSTAINTVRSTFGQDASLTSAPDLMSILTAPNSNGTSGLIAKISGTNSGTLLGSINSVATQLDGSTSMTGTAGDSQTGILAAQIGGIQNGSTQLSTAIVDVGEQIGDSGPLAARIGNPTINGTSADLSSVIGGSGASIAAQLGDPVTATGGLSALIDASGASYSGVFSPSALSALTGSTSLTDQTNAFLALMGPSAWLNSFDNNLTFSPGPQPPSTLGALVGDATSTS
jgi:fibronectin-binding autotransporter adhesin